MDNQWSLYGISSMVLLVLAKRTIDSGHLGLTCLLLVILFVQVTGAALCAHQKRHKKGIPSSK